MPDAYPLDQAGPTTAADIAAAWERELPGVPTDSIPVVTTLWRLAKVLADDRRRWLHDRGVDAATLDLVSTLRRSGPPYALTTRQLAERSLVTAGAVSQRVARAEDASLVVRGPATGRPKTVTVTLTTAGHGLAERTVGDLLRRESGLLDSLPPERRASLAAMLDTLLTDVSRRTGA